MSILFTDKVVQSKDFPILCKKTKKDKIILWKIYVEEIKESHKLFSCIYTDSYYEDGKHKISEPTTITGKNIGKKNETSDFQQAVSRAQSMWQRKLDTGYFLYNETNNHVIIPSSNSSHILGSIPRPMLANKYTKYGQKYLNEPFAICKKLDGVRVIAMYDMENKNVELFTRNGKRIKFLDNIKYNLKNIYEKNKCTGVILDGEIYTHDISFNIISGCVRSDKNKNNRDSDMEYWVFDMVNTELEYCDRMEKLKKIFKNYKDCNNIKLLEYVLASHVDVEKYHNEYVEKGYEGLIMRELSSKYEIDCRSNYLLKYKEFDDEEFTIKDFTCGSGNEKDTIIFICETESGKLFHVRPKGTMEKKREMYYTGDGFVGKKLTVRFQDKDKETGIPRFPVGIIVRDYE